MKPIGFPEARHLRRTMRKAGALDSHTAPPASAFNDILDSDIDLYVEAGMLREGRSGTFYLQEATASAIIRRQTVIAIVFWFLIVIIVPVSPQLANS